VEIADCGLVLRLFQQLTHVDVEQQKTVAALDRKLVNFSA
jgi:hypothetical protein